MLIPWLHTIGEDEQLIVERWGKRWTVRGPRTFFAQPFMRVKRQKAIVIDPTEYLLVRDTVNGELRNVVGPQRFFPAVHDEIVARRTVIPLKKNHYVRLIDRQTGAIRVVQGEASVYLEPTEDVLDEPQTGINVDEHTAVLVRNISTGQLELVTRPQVFIPSADQEIVEKRKRILLQDHEVVVVKDPEGRYGLRSGHTHQRSFFLPPYHELLVFRWSSGLHKDQRGLVISHLDVRPKFMWYAFEARTQDNVEIIIDITFFWQLLDVAAMVLTTDDITGDICAHARSSIIQAVSQVTLERFLAHFNEIVRDAVIVPEDHFYAERGVKLHSVEVRSVTCKDPSTQRILQEIIQETTNRINRLQKQESENEIRLKQIQGEIEVEQTRDQLLAIRRSVSQTEAVIVGESEAARIRTFFAQLGDQITSDAKLTIFHAMRKQEMLASLSHGKANLYFTPADVDLSIETHTN